MLLLPGEFRFPQNQAKFIGHRSQEKTSTMQFLRLMQ